jgi:hypothetical protein
MDGTEINIPCGVTLASSSEESMEPPPNAVARKLRKKIYNYLRPRYTRGQGGKLKVSRPYSAESH